MFQTNNFQPFSTINLEVDKCFDGFPLWPQTLEQTNDYHTNNCFQNKSLPGTASLHINITLVCSQ